MSSEKPMRKKCKLPHLIAAFFVLGGVAHALATIIYLLPPSPLRNATAGPVFHYMNTLFTQNWHLFSPHPGSSYLRLQVRCEQSENKWSEWTDPLAKIEAEHFQTRITGRGKVLYVYRRIGEGVWEDFSAVHARCRPPAPQKEARDLKEPTVSRLADFCLNDETKMQRVRARPKFKLAQRLADSTCRTLDSSLQKTQSQMRLVRFFPVAYSDRSKEKPPRKVLVVPLYETSKSTRGDSNADL